MKQRLVVDRLLARVHVGQPAALRVQFRHVSVVDRLVGRDVVGGVRALAKVGQLDPVRVLVLHTLEHHVRVLVGPLDHGDRVAVRSVAGVRGLGLGLVAGARSQHDEHRRSQHRRLAEQGWCHAWFL